MRNAFAQELTRIASENNKVVLLTGDMGNKLFDEFKSVAAERFYNCGVAEANMTGMAAGMSLMGLRPVTYTITPFAVIRCMEQIRIDLCYHNLPVIIAGAGSGYSYAPLGPTHHSCDDIGLLRMFPNMTIICPCDPVEARLALRSALSHNGPVYIRLAKKGEPVIHKTIPEFKIGKSITIKEGKDICLLSTGNIMSIALEAAQELEKKKISCRLESFHTVKPLDTETLGEIFSNYKLVVTIEEHSLIGGMGSAVAEWMVDRRIFQGRLLRFGVKDMFLTCVASQEYARACHGLVVERIVNEAANAIGI